MDLRSGLSGSRYRKFVCLFVGIEMREIALTHYYSPDDTTIMLTALVMSLISIFFTSLIL